MNYFKKIEDDIIDGSKEFCNNHNIKFDDMTENIIRNSLREQLDILGITDGDNSNWFQRLPITYRYLYYMIGGITIGLLINIF
jgi:hypothetical protein